MNRTIISDSYAPFGTFTALPDKPEPKQEEREAARRADQVGHFDLIRERKWSDADVALAQRFGLLPPGGDCGGSRPILNNEGFVRGSQVYYSRAKLTERERELKTFAKSLK